MRATCRPLALGEPRRRVPQGREAVGARAAGSCSVTQGGDGRAEGGRRRRRRPWPSRGRSCTCRPRPRPGRAPGVRRRARGRAGWCPRTRRPAAAAARRRRPRCRRGSSGVVEHAVDLLEQVVDVGAAGGRVGEVELPVGVGRPDDPVRAPRDDEQHALLGAQDRARPSALIRSRGTTRWMPLEARTWSWPAAADQLLDVVGPHPGGVDDWRARTSILAGLEVRDPAPDDAVALAQEADDPCPGRTVAP